jgi:hypothetical protein
MHHLHTLPCYRRALHSVRALAVLPALLGAVSPTWGAAAATATLCEARSGAQRTPVIELYTSEGCSSCPPADQWLSTLKGQAVVAQAFHVGYWDYIGWVDRFATQANTARQNEVARANHLNTIYTPQIVRDGKDWPLWRTESLLQGSRAASFSGAKFLNAAPRAAQANTTAQVAIAMQRIAQTDQYTARVTPADGVSHWSAYWTVTEHGHNSKVKAGENKGEFLQHDFVVRQYVPVGRYEGAQTLGFASIAPQPGHARQINLVVHDSRSGEPLQALSLQCN